MVQGFESRLQKTDQVVADRDDGEPLNCPLDLLHEELAIPTDAPEWLQKMIGGRCAAEASEAFWNKVEAFEKRSDAQLAKDVTIGLPVELTADQNIVLVRDFVERHITAKGTHVRGSEQSTHRIYPRIAEPAKRHRSDAIAKAAAKENSQFTSAPSSSASAASSAPASRRFICR